MNEFCSIGLHNFTDWEDKDMGLRQVRKCRACAVVEQRPWEPTETVRPPHDPYADLMR